MKGARRILLLLLLVLIFPLPFLPMGIPSVSSIPSMINSQKIHVFESQSIRTPIEVHTPMTNGLPPRNWTVLVYMAADNDHENAAFLNIKEMEVVGSTQQVNIIVYVDFQTNGTLFNSGAYTFNITQDTPPTNGSIISQSLNTTLPTEPNMGDPTTLLNFITFGQKYSQAEHYMLIVWDKGTGYTGVCYDETSGGDRLLPQEIAHVLENDTIEPIDITAFDASLMGQLELAYEIQDGTEYIIFSEETVLRQHFPYHIFLNSLILHEASSPFLLAKEVVDRYIEAYSPGGTYYSEFSIPPSTLCLSVINASRVGDIFTWFYQTINWLNTNDNTRSFYFEICTARGLAQQFSVPNYIDLGSFAHQLFQFIPIPAFKNLVGNLTIRIQNAVSYQRHLPGAPDATGLGINFAYYEPVPLSLLTNTAYEDFISEFLTIGETETSSILTLSLVSITGYLDGKSDSVYYRFTSQIAAEHTISLTAFQHVDEDFDLYLYDANMNLLARSVELTSDEVVQWALVPGQLYYLRVFSSSSSEITYGLGSFEIVIKASSPVDPAKQAIQIGIIIIIVCIIMGSIYFIRRNWERITEAIERYRIERSAKRPQNIAPVAEATGLTSTSICAKCGEQLPGDARFCPNCKETVEGSSAKKKD